MDPIEYIKTSTDVSFLKEMLTKWIPIDYDNLKRNYPFDLEIKMMYDGKYTPDELLKLKTEGIDKIKAIVETRIKELEQ
jgi:hypothetical protein